MFSMKKVAVTIDSSNRSEHEPMFKVRKNTSYELYGLRALRGQKDKTKSGNFCSKKAPEFMQRVTVKARVVKMRSTKGIRNLRAHVSYLERSGTGIDGQGPKFFSTNQNNEALKVRSFVGKWAEDPHHFRFIISPENGSELPLEELVKKVMEGVQKEVGGKIQWFSACHYNTDNPHAHVVLRGARDDGTPLYLPRDFISKGIRDLACQGATIYLGSRGLDEVKAGITKTIAQRKLTYFDQEILLKTKQSELGVFIVPPLSECKNEYERGKRNNHLARLEFLESIGLASKETDGRFQLVAGFEKFLKHLGNVENAKSAIYQSLPLATIPSDLMVYNRFSPLKDDVTGKLLARAVRNELTDEIALYVGGYDGRMHFIPIGKYAEAEGFCAKQGEIITVSKGRPKMADEVLLNFGARRSNGLDSGFVVSFNALRSQIQVANAQDRWKIPQELTIEEYCERFRSRLESLTECSIAKKMDSDKWLIPKDLHQKVELLEEQRGGQEIRVKVVKESSFSLFEQTYCSGPTWLDRQIEKQVSGKLEPIGSKHFGAELIDAINLRKEVLKDRGINLKPNYSDDLYRAQAKSLCEALSIKGSGCRLVTNGESFSAVFKGYQLIGDLEHLLVARGEELILGPKSVAAFKLEEGRAYEFEFVGKENQCLSKSFLKVFSVKERQREKEKSFNLGVQK